MTELAGSFWLLDEQHIQGQAGKPFIHEIGPIIKFPPESDSIDNACLCKYRYLRYYAFYQYVNQKKQSNLSFFKDLTSDSQGFVDYSTQEAQGYAWGSLSGPHYLGCYPTGTFTLGKWLDVDLPYSSSDSISNTTFPSPYYIYQTTEPDKASLKCMIVSSYKCCNGQKGCGIQIPRSSDSILTFSFPICVQDFYVTNLQAALAGESDAAVTPIKGSQQCCVHRYTKKEQLLSCDTAVVRAYNFINESGESDCQEHCQQCLKSLPEAAKGIAEGLARRNKCVNWLLWKWNFFECDKCNVQEIVAQLVPDYSQVPFPEVIGKGGGWAPIKFHDPDKQYIYCSPTGAVVYQWTYSQNKQLGPLDFVPPPNLTQNPCKNDCGSYGGDLRDVGVSDSLSGVSNSRIPDSQKPCNTPDPYGRLYKQFAFQDFDVWYLRVTKVTQDDPAENYLADPCFTTYKIDPQSMLQDGKLKWTRQYLKKKDYQLQQQGLFKGSAFQHFKDAGSGKMYLAIPSQQDPPQTVSDARMNKFNISFIQGQFYVQDTSQNNCKFLYQVYMIGCRCPDAQCESNSCSQKVPYVSSTVCTKWRKIGKVHQEVLQEKGVVIGSWTNSTVQNTFSDTQRGPIGLFVYSVLTQDASYCGALPKTDGGMAFVYLKEVLQPACDNSSGGMITEVTSMQKVKKPYPFCQPSPGANFIAGWKLSDSITAQQMQTNQWGTLQPHDACKVYYMRAIGDFPMSNSSQVQDLSGSGIFPENGIQWGSKCLKYYMSYCVRKKSAKYTDKPQPWQQRRIEVSDAYTAFARGWYNGDTPAADAYIKDNEPAANCQAYFIRPTNEVSCKEDQSCSCTFDDLPPWPAHPQWPAGCCLYYCVTRREYTAESLQGPWQLQTQETQIQTDCQFDINQTQVITQQESYYIKVEYEVSEGFDSPEEAQQFCYGVQ